MYSHGICLEYADKGKSNLYCCSGGYKRPYHPRGVRANRKVSPWRFQCVGTLQHAFREYFPICGHSACGRYRDKAKGHQKQRRRIL